MIYFVVQRGHDYTLRNFCESWGRKIRGRVVARSYDDLARARRLPRGVWVFADHDRLTEPALTLGARVADRLATAGCPVLSHPARTLRRVPLLAALHRAGINDFRAVRVCDGLPDDLRFPVFLRLANEHKGHLCEPVRSRADLLQRIAASPHKDSPHLLAVEFCDTADADGVYHKHGATRIGAAIVPRHVFASRHWMTKLNDKVDEGWLKTEADYFERFDRDFAPQLRPIFDLAGVEFGRIDFSMKRDGIRVWEINTNPMLVATPDTIDPRRLALQSVSAARIVEAIAALDREMTGQVRVRLDSRLRRAAGVTRGQEALRVLGKVLHRWRRLPGFAWWERTSDRARRLAEW